MTSEENLEEWDESFLEELIQVEELALSSVSYNQNTPLSSALPPPPPPPEPPHVPPPSRFETFSYSPPRELSQRPLNHQERSSNGGRVKSAAPSTPSRRTPPSYCAKDLEIEWSKKKRGRVSKQLTDLEHEYWELKKEKNKEPIRIVDSRNEEKIVKHQSSKTENIEHGFSGVAHHVIPQESANEESPVVHRAKSSYRAVGVQSELPIHLAISGKLREVWGWSNNRTLGRNLILKLLAVCATDFRVLLGFMQINSSSEKMDHHKIESLGDAAPQHKNHSFHVSEAAKISNLHFVVTKISSGMMQVQSLFEALLDLCKVQNVVIVHRSLHILLVLLKHLSSFERKSKGRENVVVEQLHASCSIENLFGCGSREVISSDGDKDESSCASHVLSGLGCFDEETFKKGDRHTCNVMASSFINWFSLFELMCQVTAKSSEECVQLEAVSIMNIVLMRSDVYTERVKFGSIMVFESLPRLLKQGAGMRLQKEAVLLFYLLLNCPKLLDSFCSGFRKGESSGSANDNEGSSASKHFPLILEGLADCITSVGNGLQELDLRRSTIILLAFIASSGKSGFEILVDHKLCREANFLMLIMQLLVSEIDVEETVGTGSGDIFRARTLLIREVLILLNRLVSNPVYSTTALRALISSRDMAGLTINIANRLSCHNPKARGSDDLIRKMRESEIVDLGQVFKKRVHTFLGDNRF